MSSGDGIKVDGQDFVIGRIVHYVMIENKNQVPAMIIRCGNGSDADLTIFAPVGPITQFEIKYDPRKRPGTWHWPSRRSRHKKQKKSQSLTQKSVAA